MNRHLIFTLFFTLCCCAAFPQSKATNGSILGLVVDSASAKPAASVTVTVTNQARQTLKKTVSDEKGNFLAPNLPAEKLFLIFIAVGYQSKTIAIERSAQQPIIDLGTVNLVAIGKQLKNVTITANNQIIKQEADKIIYDLQADPDSKSFSVLEMMRKVPMISVDADDNIQLNGNGAYRIFINGKPSSLMERNPKDVLRSMPGASIQKIEVITSPSAKYDAEGLAGIINIITNKNVQNGYTGSVNLNERFPQGGPSVGTSLSSKSGKLGFSVFGGAGYGNTPSTSADIIRNSIEAQPTNLIQNSLRTSDNRNAYLGTELSYELDSLNLISAQLGINGGSGDGSFSQRSQLNRNAALLQGFLLDGNNENTGNGGDAAINYQLGFRRNKNQLLTLSYRFYGFSNDDASLQSFSERNNYDLADFRQTNQSMMREHTMQLDYVHPVRKLTIEAGVKGILRRNESDFQHLSINDEGVFINDPSKTNTFNNTQDILAAYNSYQLDLKNKWSVKAGIRLEHTSVDADFVSTATGVRQNYFSVVPSVSLSKRFTNTGISFGWNQRLQRPGIKQLNPFIDRSDPLFENTGNPDLHPTTGNLLRLGLDWNKKGSLNINVMYSWIQGLIFQVSDFDPATTITRTRYGNTGGSKALGGNVNFNYPLTKAWNLSLNGNLMHGWATGTSGGLPIKNKGFMYKVNLTTGIRLQNTWRLSGTAFLNGGELTIQQQSNSYVSTAFNLSKDLVKDKLSFAAFTNNPFNRYRTNVSDRFGPNFNQVNSSQLNFRAVGASLNYKFGKMKEAIKKNKRGISNDDISKD